MRVILVDEENAILRGIEALLDNHPGIEVVGMYTNPLQVMPELRATDPDCAFMDIQMSGMSGLDLAKRLLEQKPDMDIVFVTEYSHYAVQAFELGALDYVLKPIHPERFLKTLERLEKACAKAAPGMDGRVIVRVLGRFEITTSQGPVRFSRSKARELTAYLLNYAGQKRNKYAICEELWPEYDPKKAIVYLQTVVCALRKSLPDAVRTQLAVSYSEECYSLGMGQIRFDAMEFAAAYASFRRAPVLSAAEEAVSVWGGDYLEGEDWAWAAPAAEVYSQKYEHLLNWLAREYLRRESYQDCVDIAMKLLKRQPSDPSVQLLLLEAAMCAGGTGMLKQYAHALERICREALDAGMEPEAAAFCHGKGI